MAKNRMVELAAVITSHTKVIDEHLMIHGLPHPSFDADCPPYLLDDECIAASRLAVLEATDELHALALGPTAILTNNSVCIDESLHPV